MVFLVYLYQLCSDYHFHILKSLKYYSNISYILLFLEYEGNSGALKNIIILIEYHLKVENILHIVFFMVINHFKPSKSVSPVSQVNSVEVHNLIFIHLRHTFLL